MDNVIPIWGMFTGEFYSLPQRIIFFVFCSVCIACVLHLFYRKFIGWIKQWEKNYRKKNHLTDFYTFRELIVQDVSRYLFAIPLWIYFKIKYGE